MLNLDSKVSINRDFIVSPNLADRFGPDDRKRSCIRVADGYTRDKQTRSAWERRNEAGMDLALQVQKGKDFPWPNCSNIAFPLVTIAALQFHARAYPTLISGQDIVKCRVVGEDPDGQKRARADRISDHMSYQVLEEDRAWEEQHDRLLINLPIVGCAFGKSYYNSSLDYNVTELVLARDLVMHYYATSTEACSRKTHIIPLFRNEIYERVQRQVFVDVLEEAWYRQAAISSPSAPMVAGVDNRKGMQPPQPDQDTPFIGLEQHCLLDLDKDGYAEPYIVTIEESSKAVLRIVARFDREEDIERTAGKKIIKIRATEYFTKYSFIPSPDGGIYDIGFGVLLGPLNESVSSILNQLVDAGTMSNSAGGFLSRGAKLRGGVHTFAPHEWKRVDSTGDDLKKSIFPLPVREPSPVLFNLLSLLINYTERISGATDTMVGQTPGQNTPAETTRAVIEQGMKIYTSIFKRVWRSMKEEFKKRYILNGIYMSERTPFGEKGGVALRNDYMGDPDQVVPVADPSLSSDAARFAQAQAIAERSQTVPGYDPEVVERNFLRALRVDGIDAFYPGPKKMPPGVNPKVEIEQLKQQGKQMQFQHEQAMFAAQLMEDQRVNQAHILKLTAEAVKLSEEAKNEGAYAQVAAINAQIGLMKAHDEMLRKRIELILKGLEIDQNAGTNNAGDVASMAAASSNTGAVAAAASPAG